MSYRILYKFPTRNRPEKFFAALDNIYANCFDRNIRIVVNIDRDDIMMMNPSVHKRLSSYHNVIALYGESKNKIQAINACMDHFQNFDILVVMSDDFEFIQHGFDEIIKKDMQHYFPDLNGVLHYPDGTPNGERIMTMQIMGREYYRKQGYIYHPDYKSVYCDNEETEKAKMLGRYRFIPSQIFKHNHWLFKLSEPDALNERNDSPEMYAHDKEVYERRKAANFYLDIPKQ